MNPKAKGLAIIFGCVAFFGMLSEFIVMAQLGKNLSVAFPAILAAATLCGLVGAAFGAAWGAVFPPGKKSDRDSG